MAEQDQGEFLILVELTPGASLQSTENVLFDIKSRMIKNIPEIDVLTIVAGSSSSGSNFGRIGVKLLPAKLRKQNTSQVKAWIRDNTQDIQKTTKVKVNDYSPIDGALSPFTLSLKSDNIDDLNKYAKVLFERMKTCKDLSDVFLNVEDGKPEFQVHLEPDKLQHLGVASATAGSELRYYVQGGVVSKFHGGNGLEYDIRMRLRPEQRNLQATYYDIKVPNVQGKMVPLSLVSTPTAKLGTSKIYRENKYRSIVIAGNLAKGGALGSAVEFAKKEMASILPKDGSMVYEFKGDAENLKELQANVLLAFGFALLFIYLVLASLYESFFTPFIILVAIPPAISGAFFALVITGESFNIFSMIGLIMLMALVTKNSILLVDFAIKGMEDGLSRKDAIYQAGKARLRPILMTSFAMIAGTLPVAMGIGEASKARTSMGVAIIGGLIVSTLLTLIVVPAIFEYMDIFREKIEKRFRPDYDMKKVGKLESSHIIVKSNEV